MASFEHLIYGNDPGVSQGRKVLAKSPGLSADCIDEVKRYCDGWGPVPAGGLRQSVILAFPMAAQMSTMPGDLHTVIRITAGLRPIFHAVVLSRADFQVFDLNPFALLQEEVFLDSWSEGESLHRLEVVPTSLAPLVTPPPNPDDVGNIDEAVRHILANERLLLPLEQAGTGAIASWR